MSRAFVKESDEAAVNEELPERPLPDHPNYVTPAGLAQLRARLHELAAEREQLKAAGDREPLARGRQLEVERDARYVAAQLERAVVVDPAGQPKDEARFGAVVTVRDAAGREREYAIVGDDEADVPAGRISWASPLAKQLIGLKLGDTATWKRPDGAMEIEVVGIRYA
jgi:transcription elongation GreA/GreB family factor